MWGNSNTAVDSKQILFKFLQICFLLCGEPARRETQQSNQDTVELTQSLKLLLHDWTISSKSASILSQKSTTSYPFMSQL